MNFHEQYCTFSDNQILDVLKNHKNYQEAAVVAAIQIAIERQLINSEQDLLSPEFQSPELEGFTIFPISTNSYHRQTMTGSIFRFLYVMAFLPVIYGFLKHGEGQLSQTYVGVGIGAVWFILCYLLKRTKKLMLIVPMLFLLFSVSSVVGVKIFGSVSFAVMDVVMLIIGTLLPVYLLLLLKKLILSNS